MYFDSLCRLLEKKIQYAGHRSCTQLFSAGPTEIVQDRNLQNSNI